MVSNFGGIKMIGLWGYGGYGAMWFVYFLRYEEAKYAPIKAKIATKRFSIWVSY